MAMTGLQKALVFLVLLIGIGLFQLWYVSLHLLFNESEVDYPTLCGDGALLFFAAALFATTVDSLLSKGWLSHSPWLTIATMFVGLGTGLILMVVYPPIANSKLSSGAPPPSADHVWTYSGGLTALNLLFAFLSHQLPLHRTTRNQLCKTRGRQS